MFVLTGQNKLRELLEPGKLLKSDFIEIIVLKLFLEIPVVEKAINI